jgi:hypothetical protein
VATIIAQDGVRGSIEKTTNGKLVAHSSRRDKDTSFMTKGTSDFVLESVGCSIFCVAIYIQGRLAARFPSYWG